MTDQPAPEPPCPGAVLVQRVYSNRWEMHPRWWEQCFVQIDHTDTRIVAGRLMQLYRIWRLPREGNPT